ncbi:MAG: hypothetical protein ABMA01_00835 [Chthoniobacteraceae bacterium]
MNHHPLTRRHFLRQSLAISAALAAAPPILLRTSSAAGAPIALGSRRELLVDDYLLGSLDGVILKLHKPEAREGVLTCDKPWEGNTSAYYTLFQDGDRFRIYYRGSHWDEVAKKATHPEFTCYAESRDGITWEKPALGLFDFQGSKENNIVLTGEGTHNFAPFKDTNPACKPEERYKALAGGTTLVNGKKKSCLHAYRSADGVRWSRTQDDAVISDGAFDSQNIAFFDNERGEYRAYWRYFSKGYTDERGWRPEGVRAIRTATSKDFIHWASQADLRYGDAPAEHLYTNAVMPYFRAPHLYVAFPTRFQPKHQQVEPVFMTSRDGVNFKRWAEELIPITAPKDRDGNRSNYMTRGLLQLPGQDRELSVYATEAYYTGPGSRVRRFVYRMDGFVSAHAATEGALITKPFTFTGSKLSLNIASRGETRVEFQDENGRPLPGFTLADCTPLQGDFLGHHVRWKGGALPAVSGSPVRLRFDLKRADLFSLQFQNEA